MTDPRYPAVPPPPPLPAVSPSPHPWPPAAYPPPAPRRRVPGWIIGVAVATAVAAVASFLTVLLWPAGGDAPVAPSEPLTFLRFGSVARVEFGQPSHTTLTAVAGDRGYAAWEQVGDIQVVAFDVPSGRERWRQEVAGPARWSRLIAAPGAVLVLEEADADDQPRQMHVLDAQTGTPRWQRQVRGDDVLAFLDGALGWLDRQGRALRGLDLATGRERWRHDFPTDEESFATSVLNQADLSRPSDPFGDPVPGVGDSRIVMVNSDRSVWVVDGDTGAIISRRNNLAEPDDKLLGYGDQLFVAPNEIDYQLLAYDLTDLAGVPRILYTPATTERYPAVLQPCGRTRVCLLESAQSDSTQTDLVAVNAVEGGEIWRATADRAERLFGVGEWAVTVTATTFQPTVSVFDQTGDQALDSPGVAMRLNEANLMVVTTAGYEEYVEALGLPVGGQRFDLGRLPDGVAREQCSWNDRYLVCPDRGGAEIWRFAQPG